MFIGIFFDHGWLHLMHHGNVDLKEGTTFFLFIGVEKIMVPFSPILNILKIYGWLLVDTKDKCSSVFSFGTHFGLLSISFNICCTISASFPSLGSKCRLIESILQKFHEQLQFMWWIHNIQVRCTRPKLVSYVEIKKTRREEGSERYQFRPGTSL